LPESDQQQVIDALQIANIKTIRLFISTIRADFKGTTSLATYDIESTDVGTFANNTVLDRLDALLPRLENAGISAIVALHDRYHLGAWWIDGYVNTFQLDVLGNGTDGRANQELSQFYANPAAMTAFDNRIAHILSYPSKSYPGRTMGELSHVIRSFNVQNEPMGHTTRRYPGWVCDRAAHAKRYTQIPISTGGGHDYASSVQEEYFTCPHLDIIGIHTYDTSMDLARTYLRHAHTLALANGKRIVLEEVGALQDKAASMRPVIEYANELGIPWMVWQTVQPNHPFDYEFWREDEPMWSLMSTEAARATQIPSAVAPE
jgi:mannan endo-1,4-beta-mannosidase